MSLTSGVTFDRNGNFYFAQFYGSADVIRKVTVDGIITTVAGEGPPGLSGDDGPATHAQLSRPHRLALDPAGVIYIPDTGNKLVRKVSIAGYDTKDIHFAEAGGVGHHISSDGLHLRTYDLETGVDLLTFGYDVDNNLTSITDQFGNIVTIDRRGDGTPFAITSPDGLRTELAIDYNNQLTQLTYPDGTGYHFSYLKDDGLLTAKTEPNGNRFGHSFDEFGRVIRTDNLEGGLWTFGRSRKYDGTVTSTVSTPNTSYQVEKLTQSTGGTNVLTITITGETISSTTSDDGLDTVTQSSCGPVVETFSNLDRKFGYTYTQSTRATTPAGLVLETSVLKDYVDIDLDGIPETTNNSVTVNGKTTVISHDVVNSTNTITSPESRVVSSTYDPLTLQTLRSSVPDMFDTLYGYQTDGKLQSVTSGSRTTWYTYDALGNLETITDPMQRVTRFTSYDAVGRLLRMERSDGTVLSYGYDENGNMTLLTTPIPADNNFTYNGVNKRSVFLTPLGSSTSYLYNAERQLTTVTLPSGKVISNSYTSGRLMETVTNEWTNSYAYGCGNLVGSITRGSESVGYDYDGDLVTAVTQAGTLNTGLNFVYNNDLNLTSFTYAGAAELYGYDNDGLLTTAGIFTITRNADNGLPEAVSDTSLTLNRFFNSYGEVASINLSLAGNSIYGYDLVRNDNGIITAREEYNNGLSNRFSYTYDLSGRLLTVTKDDLLVEEYRYDDNGNRTYEMNSSLGIAGRDYTSSLEDHTVTAGQITYEYDFDDNLAARVDGSLRTEFYYSSTGELLRVALPDGTAISYINDPLGRRIAKKINGVVKEKYLWSGLTTLLAVYDSSDNLLQRFTYADGRLPAMMTTPTGSYYMAYDQVGSLRHVADASGTVIKQVDYDSFGNILSDSNPAFTVPFGFAGGLHDRDTGLVRFGYRDYMPEIGKWTAKDPILFAGGDSNLYGYVGGDPVNYIDPEGLSAQSDFLEGMRSYFGGISSSAEQIGRLLGTQGTCEQLKAVPETLLTSALEREILSNPEAQKWAAKQFVDYAKKNPGKVAGNIAVRVGISYSLGGSIPGFAIATGLHVISTHGSLTDLVREKINELCPCN